MNAAELQPAEGNLFWSAPVSADGFNLMPYRQLLPARARRRCLIELLVAALIGSGAVLAVACWQFHLRERINRQLAGVEQTIAQMRGPLEEHARLTLEAAQAKQRAARVATLSIPLEHLLETFDALGSEPVDDVVVQRLRHTASETELQVRASSHAGFAAWFERIDSVRGVERAEVKPVQRQMQGAGDTRIQASSAAPDGSLERAAVLHWRDTSTPEAREPVSAQQRSPIRKGSATRDAT